MLENPLIEEKLQRIIKFLNKFTGKTHTREEAMELVIEHFYSDYFSQIESDNRLLK